MKTLKTKIVATIGSANGGQGCSYSNGIIDSTGNPIGSGSITYEYLVQEFCNSGVDIIRMNLSHINAGDIPPVFTQIKRAILAWEEANKGRMVALLADLPGPKIRFHMSTPVDFSKIDRFTIHFSQEVSNEKEATVYVNDQPLKKAILDFDRNSGLPRVFQAGGRLGKGGKDSFAALLDEIEAAENVMVIIGDGDVVLELLPRGLDKVNAAMACRVVTVKKPLISGKKGFTLKGVHVDIPSFTREDQDKLDCLINSEYHPDNQPGNPVIAYLALSFVQSPDDILRLSHYLENKLEKIAHIDSRRARLLVPAIIAKIETELGWNNRDYILDVADGIMVARGDLGLQMNIETVPRIQKELIQLCNKRGKPVITATEMLQSMTAGIEPTRAEATDVFNAILDGSDAVMTSDETSTGKYPFHATAKMRRIAQQAESYFELEHIEEESSRRNAFLQRYQEFLEDDYKRIENTGVRIKEILYLLCEKIGASGDDYDPPFLLWQQRLYQSKMGKTGEQTTTNRITQATCMMSEAEEVRYIIAASTSGRTVRMISRLRPRILIIGAAHDMLNARKLVLNYGVKPICAGKVTDSASTQEVFEKCRDLILADPVLDPPARQGDLVIFTAGTPLGKVGSTNLIEMMKL